MYILKFAVRNFSFIDKKLIRNYKCPSRKTVRLQENEYWKYSSKIKKRKHVQEYTGVDQPLRNKKNVENI